MMTSAYTLAMLFMVVMTTGGEKCPAQCTCKWSEGLVFCKNIGVVPTFGNTSSVRVLTLSPHTMAKVTPEDFSNFTFLFHLNLSNGTISSLDENSFQAVIGTLAYINLSGNKLKEIRPGTFRNLSSLIHLDLSNNQLTNLQPRTFVGLPRLTFVTLAGNNLNNISENAGADVSIETLELFNNQLENIPMPFLKSLNSVKNVFLDDNKISTLDILPGDRITSLETLSLSGNSISASHVNNLAIFPAISPVLKSLNLSFCNLTDVLFSFKFFQNVSTLETLDLSGNLFHAAFFREFHGLVNLTRFHFSSMPMLQQVDSGAFELYNLKMLDLSNNPKLRVIYDGAFRLTPKLKTVYLNNNSLETLKESLLPWSTMEEVRLGNNKFVCDCSMIWVTQPSYYKNNKRTFESITCTSPPDLAGRKAALLDAASFRCQSGIDKASKVKTGLIAAGLTCLILTVFTLMVKFRKKIMFSLRRQFQYRRYKNDMVYTVEHDTSVAEMEETTEEDHPLRESRLETVPL